MGLLVMAPMGLNGFNKGLNQSSDGSDSDFFFNGFDRGLLCVFFLVLTVDHGLLVVVVLGVCSAVVVVIVVLE